MSRDDVAAVGATGCMGCFAVFMAFGPFWIIGGAIVVAALVLS